jgi:hypothetical protein
VSGQAVGPASRRPAARCRRPSPADSALTPWDCQLCRPHPSPARGPADRAPKRGAARARLDVDPDGARQRAVLRRVREEGREAHVGPRCDDEVAAGPADGQDGAVAGRRRERGAVGAIDRPRHPVGVRGGRRGQKGLVGSRGVPGPGKLRGSGPKGWSGRRRRGWPRRGYGRTCLGAQSRRWAGWRARGRCPRARWWWWRCRAR